MRRSSRLQAKQKEQEQNESEDEIAKEKNTKVEKEKNKNKRNKRKKEEISSEEESSSEESSVENARIAKQAQKKKKGNKGASNNKEDTEAKPTYKAEIPVDGFCLFDNLFPEFLYNICAAMTLSGAQNFLVTCKSIHKLSASNECATRILQVNAPISIANRGLSDQYFHEALLAGHFLANYRNLLEVENEKHKLLEELPCEFDLASCRGHLLGEGVPDEFEELVYKTNLLSQERSTIFSNLVATSMASFKTTPVFQAYCRLFSYSLSAFPLIQDVHKVPFMFSARPLHALEKALFDEVSNKANVKPVNPLIHDFKQFKANMNKNFKMSQWEDFIEWDKFLLVGGSVLKCLMANSFESDAQDVDFFWLGDDFNEFEESVEKFVTTCSKFKAKEKEESSTYVRSVTATFAKKVVTFQFIWYDDNMPPGEILHIFDLDCCQVGYNGKSVVSTYSFASSVSTMTMINYKLINNKNDLSTFTKRTFKYQSRGFKLLVPKQFDTSLLSENREDYKLHLKGDYGGFLLNNDSLDVRKHFVDLIAK